MRKNKGLNVSLSDEEYDEEQDSNEEDYTALNALLERKNWLQVKLLGVALPKRNILANSVCLNAITPVELSDHEIQDVDDEEVTLEDVQRMYEELYSDWIRRNKQYLILTKENVDLKAAFGKLEVLLCKKDVEFCLIKKDLEKATQTLTKFNSSSTKLESILSMGNDSKARLWLYNNKFEVGETSKSTVFVRESNLTSNTRTETPSVKKPPTSVHNSVSKSKETQLYMSLLSHVWSY